MGNLPVPRATAQRTLTTDNFASPIGCCNFFDECNEGIFSLYYRGRLGLLDWLGFNPTNICYRSVEFIPYVRPEQSTGQDTPGYLADPCATPNGIEFGSCKLTVENFGRYGRKGPVRDIWHPEKRCINSPRFFLDGAPVTDEATWDKIFTMDQLLNDLRLAVTTDSTLSGAGHFDGLQRWVRNGYDCSALDSLVVNWNANDFDGNGGGAITINGNPMIGAFGIIDLLLDANRRYNQRIGWSPFLSGQAANGMDKIIVAPLFLLQCLLDSFTCWSVCPAGALLENLGERREFRLTLNGGRFGAGKIYLDGEQIDLLPYEWGNILGPTRGDMYFLTGAVGSQRIWEGEHLDANIAVSEVQKMTGGNNLSYYPMDGGRVLAASYFENLCGEQFLWMMPRLFCKAPYLQMRIQNVVCRTPLGPLSADPGDTSFFPQTSFSQAQCPT